MAAQNVAPGISGQKRSDTMTPNSGATEKYAPVRAVPSVHKATTNNIRLRP